MQKHFINSYYAVFWLVGELFRKGQFSLKVSDGQFFSQPEVVTVQAFSTQVRAQSLRTTQIL